MAGTCAPAARRCRSPTAGHVGRAATHVPRRRSRATVRGCPQGVPWTRVPGGPLPSRAPPCAGWRSDQLHAGQTVTQLCKGGPTWFVLLWVVEVCFHVRTRPSQGPHKALTQLCETMRCGHPACCIRTSQPIPLRGLKTKHVKHINSTINRVSGTPPEGQRSTAAGSVGGTSTSHTSSSEASNRSFMMPSCCPCHARNDARIILIY